MLLFFLITCAASLGVSFFCSLTEAVLLSLNPLDLKLQEKKGIHNAQRWLVMKNHIERPISAILVFNTLANTGLATLAGALFTGLYGAEWLWLFSVVMSAAVLLGGEMTPKIIGVHHASRFAPRLIGPLSWMLLICHPLVLLMEKFCERLGRRPHAERSHHGHHHARAVRPCRAAPAQSRGDHHDPCRHPQRPPGEDGHGAPRGHAHL